MIELYRQNRGEQKMIKQCTACLAICEPKGIRAGDESLEICPECKSTESFVPARYQVEQQYVGYVVFDSEIEQDGETNCAVGGSMRESEALEQAMRLNQGAVSVS